MKSRTNDEALVLLARHRNVLREWWHPQADHGDDNVQHIGSEDIRNTEREAENNTQNTGPIIILLERAVFTKVAALGGSHLAQTRAAQIDDRIEVGIETEGVEQIDN